MTPQEYETISKHRDAYPAMISIKDAQFFIPTKEGTLLWGYTCERYSFHVYIKDGLLHRLIYSTSESKVIDHISGESLKAEDLHPDKRIYPEATSFDFIIALYKAGQDPSITRYDHERPERQWHGKILEEIRGKAIVFNDIT